LIDDSKTNYRRGSLWGISNSVNHLCNGDEKTDNDHQERNWSAAPRQRPEPTRKVAIRYIAVIKQPEPNEERNPSEKEEADARR
jgi:hypothetical protein